MNTLQHSLMELISLIENKSRNLKTNEELIGKFKEELPYILFPDAIRAYVGPREPSHFEKSVDGKDVAYMVFPDKETIKKLTKENANQLIKTYMPPKTQKAVIGEDTSIETFDKYNQNLDDTAKYLYKTHLLQDVQLDKTLRRMVDVKGRFEDEFIINATNEKIDGKELRQEVAKFENLGFLELARIVHQKTGIKTNQKWFDEVVYTVLKEAYPEDLAERTYNYMKIPKEIDEKITQGDFKIDNYDLKLVPEKDLKLVFKEMYVPAIRDTIEQQNQKDQVEKQSGEFAEER